MTFQIDPLIALGVVLATATTDAAYVFFNAAVVARHRVRAANWSAIKSMFGSWVVVTAIVIVVLAVVLGGLVSVRNAEIRTTTGLVSGFRFASLGLIIIGTQLGGNPDYLGPAITFALVDFVLPFALAVELGRRTKARTPNVQRSDPTTDHLN